jgi:hypothetical protein
MSSAFKRRDQPDADNRFRRLQTHHALAERKDIRIVVLASEPRGFDIPA